MTGPNHPSILPKHTTRGTIAGFLPSSNLSMWPRNYNHIRDLISQVIIHQIFSLVHDWSKHVTWPNIPQLKLGNIREKSPIVKTAHAVKKIWRIINMTASIWGENMLRYLSLDIIWSPKLAVFLTPNSQKIVRFSEQIMSADKYQSILSVPDGGHCLFIGSFWTLYQRQGLKSMPRKTLKRTCFSKGIVVDHRVELKVEKLIKHQPFFLIPTISHTWQQINQMGDIKLMI